MQVNASLKDSVLNFLCENCNLEQHSFVSGDSQVKQILTELSLSFEELNAVLTYFQRLSLISDLNARRSAISFVLRMEANDLRLQGGFTFQESIVQTNMEQLLLEIQVLKKQLGPDHLDTVNKIASIAGVVISAAASFTGR